MDGVASISVQTTIAAPPERVWAEIEDIGSHVRWMEDAVAIRFTSAERSGEGAAFDCDTKLGPFHLTDRMVVTEWDPPRALGIRHAGVVTGTGRFLLEPSVSGTRFTWEEELDFPARMGGGVGGTLAAPLLRWVWRRNLANLKSLVEGPPAV
jgi:carbon monoxide dehydrogenase subunit G